ncbi:MAG: helix-turn-helix domain-containing protein [Thaumarchaeota archaeon]|nr:helix-turn-helix domain-containing protein [Candidatus Geocrenenecus arthurdayi]MCL7389485.1 helix-turn-helix domain-containing protein [Candidatus Geocrenenecus arthurdayi]MCL7396593.1 helix-turn-helix domain-containing protein [Candidatus Geocrenenecus arthurdayi]
MPLGSIDSTSEDELVWLLRHKTRRRIILAIGDAGKISATTLRDMLKISTGSLYYNLRQLKDFVRQDEDRNYTLTEEGERVYRVLKEGGVLSLDLLKPKPPSRFMKLLTNMFFPIWLFSPLYESTGLRVITSTLSIMVSILLLIYTRTTPLILHIYESSTNIFEIVAKYLGNLVIMYLLLTFISILISGRLFHYKGVGKTMDSIKSIALSSLNEELKFFSSLIIAIIPMIFYPGLLALNRFFNLHLLPEPGKPGYYQIRDLYMIIAQSISLPFLIALTAYGRRLSGTTAAIVVLLIYFISHVVSQLLMISF